MVCLEVSILKSGTNFERQSATLARVEKSWRAGKSATLHGPGRRRSGLPCGGGPAEDSGQRCSIF